MTDTLIAMPLLSDAAVALTASTEAAGAPVANLKKIQPTDTWRSTTTTPYLVVDLGSTVSFNLIALLFTNMNQAATWRIRTASSQANLTNGSHTYDSGYVNFTPWATIQTRRHGFMYRSAGWSNRWVRIDISNTTNTNGYIDVGRLYISQAYMPVWPRSPGAAAGVIDVSPRMRTGRGNTIPNRQGIIPTVEFELNMPTEAEFYNNHYKIQMLRGSSKDVLVIFDPTDATYGHDKIYYGLLEPTMRCVNSDYRQYIQQYKLEGLI